LVGFHIKDYVFNKEVFKGRIVELKEQKWFMPKFIEFQYGRLRNNNSTHISVLKILEDNNLLNYAKGDGRLLLKDDKVDEKLRQEVFKECNGLCVYCGNVLSDEFEIDHITPTIKGGETKKNNLVSCCPECNRFKSDYSLEEFINRRGLSGDLINQRLKVFKKGLFSPYVGAKDKDMDKDKVKDKDNTTEVGGLLLKNRFLVDLKSTYKMLNVDSEILACISWHKNKGSKVKSWDRAISNWLKIAYEKTGVVGFEKAESKLKPVDKNCKICDGIGFVWNQAKSANDICHCRIKEGK
jgi:hypothetical protein